MILIQIIGNISYHCNKSYFHSANLFLYVRYLLEIYFMQSCRQLMGMCPHKKRPNCRRMSSLPKIKFNQFKCLENLEASMISFANCEKK